MFEWEAMLEALECRAHFAATPLPDFAWKMEERYGVDANHNGLIDLPNSRQYANPRGFPIDLDASASRSDTRIVKYQWTFSGGELKKPLVVKSNHPLVEKLLVPQGTFNVELKVTDAAKVPASISQQVTVRDYLIVALGDSYGSGEGNPERPSTNPDRVKWADGFSAGMTRENFEAHRSTASASSQAALLLEQSDPHSSVTYINLCQTGADIPHGMLGPKSGGTHASYRLPGQVSELRRIIGSRPIDALVLSIGGNDFGFTGYLAALIQKDSSDADTTALQSKAQAALATLATRYDQLAVALGQFTVKHALITPYPDPTQVAPGQFMSMATDYVPGGGYGMSAGSAQFASQDLLGPLNAEIQSAAAGRWEYVGGYLPDFFSHGYAAPTPWFRTEAEARTIQGSETNYLGVIPISTGGFHPDGPGLADIGQSLYGALSADLV